MLTAAEQQLVDEMVAARSTDGPKPPWMQSHRMTRVRKEARRRIAALPPRPTAPTTTSRYQATRRVTGTPIGEYAVHECDGDLPICALGTHFAANNIPRVQLGPGPVDCGHCAARNR